MQRATGKTMRRSIRFAVAPLLFFSALLAARAAQAGGGPENVLLVVNERSWSSLTIANHYIHLRGIPPQNVVYLPWTLDNERIDAATMREKLLGPIFAELERRKLGDHIDYIVYSADFPTLIDASTDIPPGAKIPPPLTPQVSLTGATFLYRKFLPKQPEYLRFDANGYFRPGTTTEVPTSHGFRSWYGWDFHHHLLEAGGEHYFLSAMLGCTSGRGNSTAEVVAMLERSAGADYSRPNGTIYFAENSDIRSTTRRPLFASAVGAIKAAGAKAETFAGTVPTNETDIVGAMLGSADFSLAAAKCKLQPGAIGEHLTSHGGMLNEGAGQTPISEWVRAGTALTSGAVWEPYAVPFKFPSAYMHLHYVRGCTSAEAYYQSISGPYQMLVLGDPLCKPWARRAKLQLPGLDFAKPFAGAVTFTPSATFDGGDEASRMEVYVDGLLIASRPHGESFTFDADRLSAGRHELRVTAVGPEPLEMRSGLIVPFDTAAQGAAVKLARIGSGPIRWGTPLELEVEASSLPVGARIAVAQGTRGYALLDAPGRLQIEPRILGTGPITIQAFVVTTPSQAPQILSMPLELTIEANEPLTPPAVPPTTSFESALPPAGLTKNEPFEFEGFIDVPEDGVYQFHLRHALKVELAVDDYVIHQHDAPSATLDYVPIALAAGRHKLSLAGTTREDPNFDIRFGLRGVRRLKPGAAK